MVSTPLTNSLSLMRKIMKIVEIILVTLTRFFSEMKAGRKITPKTSLHLKSSDTIMKAESMQMAMPFDSFGLLVGLVQSVFLFSKRTSRKETID
jgi:hypothetical protein